jgi:triacylglycerol lipase
MIKIPSKIDVQPSISWEMAFVFANFSLFSYDDESGIKSKLKNTGFDLKKFIQKSARDRNWLGRRKIECFVAADEECKTVVISFRGTESFSEATISSTSNKSKFHGILSHDGYVKAYGVIKDSLLAVLNNCVSSDTVIYFTGHSLGGSLAQVAALDLKEIYSIGGIYTFGQPKVFKSDPHISNNWYIVHKNDPVPELNPAFKHFGRCGQLGTRSLEPTGIAFIDAGKYWWYASFGHHKNVNYIKEIKTKINSRDVNRQYAEIFNQPNIA